MNGEDAMEWDIRPPKYRPGDVMRSQADIARAREMLGYAPAHTVAQGLDLAMEWYRANLA